MTGFHALVHLADELYARFEQEGTLSDLSLAVVRYRSALTLASSDPAPSNDVRSKLLSNLANVLSIRFQRCGDIADLTRSIECYVTALELRSPGHPGRASTLANYATALLLQYGQLGVEEDIKLAIEHLQAVLEILPPSDPNRLIPLMNYASALFSRFQCTEDISDLDKAISEYHSILNTPSLENKATACYNFANALLSRFKVRDDPIDLDSSIKYSRAALAALKEGHPDHPSIITGLATGLIRRFELRGDATDLEYAIRNFRLALDLRPPGNPSRFSALSDGADALVMRYNRRVEFVDLQMAIDHYREALRLLPPNHKGEPVLLDNLGNTLFLRHARLGDLKDLDEAIEKHRLALDLCAGHPVRAVLMLEALANCYNIRFKEQKHSTDLHSAIYYFNEALSLAPADHPHYASILINIALCLGTRFRVYCELADLDRAISCSREALEILSPGHQDRALTLHTLAEVLLYRFEEKGNEFDIQQAYLYCSASLNMRTLNVPERASSEILFARVSRARLLPWNDAQDLEPIFLYLGRAKDFCMTNDPLLLEVYAELSTAHFLRYLLTQQPSELKQALGHHQLSLTLAGGTSFPALRASMQWVRDAEMHNHSLMVDAYRTAIRLLDRLVLETTCPDIRHFLVERNVAKLAGDAASSALMFQQPAVAIDMLEHARMLLWAQLVRVTTDLDDLRVTDTQGAELASELERLNAELGGVSTMSKKSRPLLKARDVVVEQIRRKQGFKDFLVQPEFSQLLKAASEGPIIIMTAGQRSCNALIVWGTGPPVCVPLPNISVSNVSLMASQFEDLTTDAGQVPCSKSKSREDQLAELLSDLWDRVVYPIVQQLIPHMPRGSRLWWCPTGKFSSIPLHAAGSYRTNAPSLSHIYVCSYTSTLSALMQSRTSSTQLPARRPPLASSISGFLKTKRSKQSLLHPPTALSSRSEPVTVIAIGHRNPEGFDDQLGIIRNCISPAVPLKCIEGEEVSTVTISKLLKESSWVHFASPVVHDPIRPFQSAFEMRDGSLTMCDVARIRPRVDFAFVSTCRVAESDRDSVIESMSLPACLQYVGFRSVIGPLCPVDTEVTRRVVSCFYENTRSAGPFHQVNAATALNEALKAIEETVPLSQRIAFVHVGI
ncbi:CHAT domain-containing protein [Pisolithus croceorrhizus]|nr:CHAT domain-containing protein [Pisolithus croceorrhizus]KAI6133984.1 CHAT domain-containing protein [Pisolithus croceorrhizus]KAI6137610.1 CHAT domain-containing protein [Pisolithus thermaeus]